MTTICCVLVVITDRAKRNRGSTAFFQSVQDTQKVIQAALTKASVTAQSGGGGGGMSSGPQISRMEHSFRWDIPAADAGKVGFHLKNEVERRLKENDCQILGTGIHGDIKIQDVSGFSFEYQAANTGGFVKVTIRPQPPDDSEIDFIVFEYSP